MLDLLEIPVDSIEGSIISSVVPPLLNSFKTAIRKLTGKCPGGGTCIKTGLNILLDNPALAGGDLIVAAVAALAEYPAPMLIIDMGTATTITAIDENEKLLWAAAFAPASKFPRKRSVVDGAAPGHQLGGAPKGHRPQYHRFHALWADDGLCAMLDGMIDRMEEELGHPVTVIATGGIADS